MTPSLLRLAPALLWLGFAPAALAQPPTPMVVEPKPDAATAAAAPVNDEAAQDRIMALVRAGKCGPAKTEATRVGDVSLAEQIGTMCGARSSDPFAKPGKSGGGGGGGGRRGGAGGGGGPGG